MRPISTSYSICCTSVPSEGPAEQGSPGVHRGSGAVTSTRRALAALDPTTGAVLPGVDIGFTGVCDPSNNYNGKMGGTTNISGST